MNINATPNTDALLNVSAAQKKVNASAPTEEQIAQYLKKQQDAEAAEKAAQRKAKTETISRTVTQGVLKTGKVTGKVGKTVWNSAFGILQGTLTVAQNAPETLVKTTKTVGTALATGTKAVGHAVAEEYRNA